MQVAISEGPTSYGAEDLEQATALADKLVANYGLSPLGITIYAPASQSRNKSGRQYEVTVESLDEDLFGKTSPGGSYQPNEQYIGRIRVAAQQLVIKAYSDDCVRHPAQLPFDFTLASSLLPMSYQ